MTIVEMSAGGAVLIAVILLLRRCLLNRLPKWTFLLLWAVALCRLLVPFTLPSQLSVYTGAARIAQAVQEEAPSEEHLPVLTPPVTVPGTFQGEGWTAPASPSPAPEREPVSPLAVVWLTGTALCGVFFGAAYLWTLRRFWDAVPATADFLTRWREEHPTLRPVQIKVSGAVNAPVAYGLIRPVILLPQNTDWTGEGQLTYILTHEYVHIRRGDLLWKLLLTAALCVHWFNPLVWVMYFRANRDLELACDEAVVRTLGLDSRKGYAYALLSAAESGFSPLCLTYTTKNHMEERIRAIMKMKKKSVAAILAAALLVAGVTAVFATSQAPVPENIDDLPSAVMTNTDPKPAPEDKSAPDDRVHPVAPGDTSTSVTPADTSAPDDRIHPITDQPDSTPADAPQEPSQTDSVKNQTPALADTSAPDDRVHPVTGQPTDTPADTPQEPSQTDPKNRWGVPADPVPQGMRFPVADEAEMEELINFLCQYRDLTICDITRSHATYDDGTTGNWAVGISYQKNNVITAPYQGGQNPEAAYPVNSRGETYGNAFDMDRLGYEPDLIAAKATNGKSGYMLWNDYEYFGYPGKTDTPEEFLAFIEWQNAQSFPITLPVYDVNRDNLIGYYEINLSNDEEFSEDELKWLEDSLRRAGIKEEDIAREIEKHRAPKN